MRQFIYILLNPSHKSILKIGRTSRSPEIRAQELSMATGVPQPFIVVYESLVSDSVLAEKLIHQQLSNDGYRISPSREFFEIPLKVAISVVDRVCKSLPETNYQIDAEIEDQNEEYGPSITNDGINHLFGTESVFQNFDLARKCFEKAINLGDNNSYIYLADIYLWGLGVRKNSAEAIRILQEGAKRENIDCLYHLWEIYSGTAFNIYSNTEDIENTEKEMHLANADIAFKLYIDSITNINASFDIDKANNYLKWVFRISPTKTALLGRHTNSMIEIITNTIHTTILQLRNARIAKIGIEQAKDKLTGKDLTLKPMMEFKELWETNSRDPSPHIKKMLLECTMSDLEYGFSRLPLQRARDKEKEYSHYLSNTPADLSNQKIVAESEPKPEIKSNWRERFISLIRSRI